MHFNVKQKTNAETVLFFSPGGPRSMKVLSKREYNGEEKGVHIDKKFDLYKLVYILKREVVCRER
jgi:hypothetical protein